MGRSVVRLIEFFLLMLPALSASAARLYGTVKDSKGEPLPYVSVLISGTSIGTTTNLQGAYTLDIKEGRQIISFSMIGFNQRVDTVEVTGSGTLHDVQLSETTYRLSEVVISTGEEDPAYAIIRQARRKREFFKKEVKAYSCESYVKSTQRLVRYPKKFMGKKVDIGEVIDTMTNIFYLSESVSRIDWQEPDKVKEKMISSKVSGNPRAYSFNRGADLVSFNVYEPLLKLGNLVPRGIVSPISDDCFMYYRYKLEGAFIEDGKLINKIKVIPRRTGDPVFSGDIFIVDENWRVHGFDLLLTKDQQLQFIDTFRIRQSAVEVDGGAWMPFSNALYFHFSIFGFEGAGDIIGVFKGYDTDTVFAKNHFNGEILSVDTTSNRRDSAYWELTRPVPLTDDESIDYRRKDSIRIIQTSPQYLDSTDAVANQFKGIEILTGYSHRNSRKNRYWSIAGPLSNLQFNTVEGWNISLSGQYRKEFGQDDGREWKISPTIRYGFSNRHVNPKIAFDYRYDTRIQGVLNIETGSEVDQFNPEDPVSPSVNTLYSLFGQKNYLKIFQQRFFAVSHRSELTNGLALGIKAGYYYRMPLDNTSDYSFDPDNPAYTINNPILPTGDTVTFQNNSAWVVTLRARIRFGQKYVTRPEARYLAGSKWPAFRLEYSKAVPVTDGSMDFDKVRISVDDELDFGLFGEFRFKVGAGRFLNTTRYEFMDIRHFNGNRTVFSNFRIDDFMGLDYFAYSTVDPYVEIHAEHHFKGLLFNKIPLIKKLRLDEVVSIHAVAVSGLSPAIELGAGVEKLNLLRVQGFASYRDGRLATPGIVVGLKKVF